MSSSIARCGQAYGRNSTCDSTATDCQPSLAHHLTRLASFVDLSLKGSQLLRLAHYDVPLSDGGNLLVVLWDRLELERVDRVLHVEVVRCPLTHSAFAIDRSILAKSPNYVADWRSTRSLWHFSFPKRLRNPLPRDDVVLVSWQLLRLLTKHDGWFVLQNRLVLELSI